MNRISRLLIVTLIVLANVFLLWVTGVFEERVFRLPAIFLSPEERLARWRDESISEADVMREWGEWVRWLNDPNRPRHI